MRGSTKLTLPEESFVPVEVRLERPSRRRASTSTPSSGGSYPAFLKRPLYRLLFGYRIGRNVRIGLALLDAQELELGDGTSIGHLSAVVRVGRFVTGREARIGPLSLIRGGERVTLGDFASVMRFNVLTSSHSSGSP